MVEMVENTFGFL